MSIVFLSREIIGFCSDMCEKVLHCQHINLYIITVCDNCCAVMAISLVVTSLPASFITTHTCFPSLTNVSLVALTSSPRQGDSPLSWFLNRSTSYHLYKWRAFPIIIYFLKFCIAISLMILLFRRAKFSFPIFIQYISNNFFTVSSTFAKDDCSSKSELITILVTT